MERGSWKKREEAVSYTHLDVYKRQLVEYALILLLIAVAVSAGLRGIGPAVAGDFDRARDALN